MPWGRSFDEYAAMFALTMFLFLWRNTLGFKLWLRR